MPAVTHARSSELPRILERVGVDRQTAGELMAAADAIGSNAQLRAVLADQSLDTDRKRAVIDRVFASVQAQTRQIVTEISGQSVEQAGDFAYLVREAAVRAVAAAADNPQVIASDLIELQQAIGEHGELELTLSSKLTPAAAKRDLARRLFAGKVRDESLDLFASLLAQPTGMRVRKLIDWTVRILTAQANRSVATVTTAVPLKDQQRTRLQTVLTAKYGRAVQITPVVNPAVLGGMRIEVGDDVIDDTVAGRLHELQRRIA